MSWPWALLFAWLVTACGFTLAVTLRLPRKRRTFPLAPLPPALVVVRPVDAPTALERATLAALPGVRQLVVSPPGVHQADWGEHLPSQPGTSNRKVGHLAAALATLPPSAVVVTADADVRLTSELLSALVTPLLEGAALCTAAPRPEALAGLGAWAFGGLLNHTHLSFRASAALTAGAPAVRGEALALGPGARALLPTLGTCAAEDLELARLLHARGARVALAEVDAPAPRGRQPLRQALRRLTRWMVVLQAHRPALAWTVPALFCASLAARS
ncbi:MAG: carotenoid biosynthesis protein, partial [Myxococcaceae bacterium]|nr:carotenoid biosynthesis protein [Myxococcaceae bacterium]